MSEYQPVVIDNGTGVVKAGVAGEDRPKVVFRSMVGRPKHKRIMAGGALDSELCVARRFRVLPRDCVASDERISWNGMRAVC